MGMVSVCCVCVCVCESIVVLISCIGLLYIGFPGMFTFDRASLKLIGKVTECTKHYPEACARITSCGNGWAAVALWKVRK